ncbi:MAG: hypothetical protein WD872_11520 [Pirellulaceae bacterium]
MTVQTVELAGERYVILREREFLELRDRVPAPSPLASVSPPVPAFREVIPLRVGGTPASELLIQDRQHFAAYHRQ